jgi:hypothetical protein
MAAWSGRPAGGPRHQTTEFIGGIKKMKREGGGGDKTVTIKIPRPLYEQLKQVIGESGFHSVTEFTVYVLRDLVSHRGIPEPPRSPVPQESPDAEVEPLSTEEIEAIRKRLSSLGYL